MCVGVTQISLKSTNLPNNSQYNAEKFLIKIVILNILSALSHEATLFKLLSPDS